MVKVLSTLGDPCRRLLHRNWHSGTVTAEMPHIQEETGGGWFTNETSQHGYHHLRPFSSSALALVFEIPTILWELVLVL